MKTYIIQIEPHDDIVSVKDKLAWCKAPRAVLVWPARGKVLDQLFELKLIKRDAAHYGIRIALVTNDWKVIENAQELDIPVFPSIPVAERQAWAGQAQKKIERSLPKGYHQLANDREEFSSKPQRGLFWEILRVTSFLLGLLAVIALAGFFIPSAQLVIYPERLTQEMQFNIWADPQLETINPSGGIPAQVQSVDLNLTGNGVSSGTVKVASGTATGKVVLVSTSSQPITLPAGTLLKAQDAEGQQYLIDQEVTLTSGVSEGVEVAIHAEYPGEEWNLPAGTTFNVLFMGADLVTAENPAPLAGGSSIEAPAPTDADYAALTTDLLRQLRENALSKLRSTLPAGDILIDQSLDAGKVINTERSVEPGSPADHFSLTLTVKYTTLSYRQSDLDTLITSIMDANLKPGFEVVPVSLNISNGEVDPGSMNHRPEWSVNAIRSVQQRLNADALAQQLAGRPITEVSGVVSAAADQRQTFQLQLFPAWWKWMPFVPFQIHIEVK